MAAVVIEKENLWEELDRAIWLPLTSLGSKWLGKWICSAKGYSIIVTDGVNFWGEQRNSAYVEDKQQEWAACLESGVEELLQLILPHLKENIAVTRMTYEDHQNRLIIELEATLDLLPFSWLFYLSKLSSHVVEHHWTMPVVATMEMMSTRITKLEEELNRKQRQLEDLLPPQSLPKKDNDISLNLSMDKAVNKIFNEGIGSCLCSNLDHSSNLLAKIANKRKEEKDPTSGLLQQNRPHNRPKLKKPQKGAFCEEDALEKEKLRAEETARRSQIEALTQAPVTSIKKRKKLNI